MALSVAGKTAIVTGAGSGINLSFAHLLLSKNCNVVLADLALRPEAEELVSQYSSSPESSARAVFQKTDVTDWSQLTRMFDVADKEFGGVDIVCPGAGVYEPKIQQLNPPTHAFQHFSNFWYPPGKPPSKDTLDSSRYAAIDINITHPIRVTQLAISHFLSPPNPQSTPRASPTNPKSIIHISSIAAQRTLLPTPIYCASKHAISGFVRSLASLEQRAGIRVTAVAPGVIKTPLWTDHPEKMKMIKENDKWISPEEVADVMLACVQEEGNVGGTILEVGKGKIRKVEALMDEGPSGEGHTVGGISELEEEAVELMMKEGWGR
ncbi:MAG: hypothetical protein M1827_004739 [Pycnora praestabilis]|nr:MAG: hypothetical protein M1827_004739 [Pycnora praestabilis]